ncbi:hypothetical protein L7F22_046670 [Adiantum nelumboides]|nr:hypothetical protein [Adiantum nelumboides]
MRAIRRPALTRRRLCKHLLLLLYSILHFSLLPGSSAYGDLAAEIRGGGWKGFPITTKVNSPAPIWWRPPDEPLSVARPSLHSSNLDFSFQSSIATGGQSDISTPFTYQDIPAFTGDQGKLFVVPVRGSETPLTRAKLPGINGSSTPEVRRKLESSDPENVHQVAMRLYKSLKLHGLFSEAEKAFRHINEAPAKSGHVDNDSEDLVGMEYMLKNGIVDYLCKFSRISPPLPRQVLRFMDINYQAKLPVDSDSFDTFGKKLLGCLFGPFMDVFRKKEFVELKILKDLVGYVMPGSMTLLLGPPGSGKSTLLKVLAGRAVVNKSITLEGMVLYNEKEAREVVLTKLIAYINGQLNRHIPYLTVRETLEFAEECTRGMRPENFSPQLRKFFAHALVEGQDPFLEYVLQVLGLKGIEGKVVGTLEAGGLSESERAQLTTAEIALGTYSVLLYDQPCADQDSIATYDLVHTLRANARIQQCSAVMSLVKLSQNTFDIFDRIILLGEGQLLYQGPCKDVLHYFSRLGYNKPAHVDSSEFLQDIAAGEGAPYLQPGSKNSVVEELAFAFRNSNHYKDILRVVYNENTLQTFWVESEPNLGLTVRTLEPRSFEQGYYDDVISSQGVEVVVTKLSNVVDYTRGIESTGRIQIGDVVTGISINDEELQYISLGSKGDHQGRMDAVHSMLKNARGHVRLQVQRLLEEQQAQDERILSEYFVQDRYAEAKTLIKRQLKVAKRLQILISLRILQVLILGLFAGTLFWRVGGVYTPADLSMVRSLGFVSSMTILLINMVQLPVYMMLRPALVYSLSVYFTAGLSVNKHGAHFVEFLALLFIVCYLGSSLVLLLSAISPILEAGNALAGLLVSIFLLFSGFVIFPSNIPRFLRWLFHINPLHWANTVYCVSQIGETYTDPCSLYLGSSTLDFCNLYPDLTVGEAYVLRFQLVPNGNKHWLGISYVIILAWIVGIKLLCFIALNKLNFSETNRSLPRPRQPRPVFSQVEKDAENASSFSGDVFASSSKERTDFSKNRDSSCVPVLQGRTQQSYGLEAGFKPDDGDEVANGGGGWRTSNIPVKPITITFHDLTFLHNDEVVFEQVSGWAKPGSMLALTGSSKSGRATLLKVLARRVPRGKLTGEILANGFRAPPKAYSRVIGFVERLDAHQPFLTVRESLHFSAALRLHNNLEARVLCSHVELVLHLLGLTHVSNQLVGSIRDAAGRTYEIAKKITIAVELAANPSVLFLDEPTSGLDSVGTRNILSALQTIAGTGRTVISTMQHPSVMSLACFSNVLILSMRGEQLYFGTMGFNCQELLRYFAAAIKQQPAVRPSYSNLPSQSSVTFVLDALGVGIKQHGPTHDFATLYRNSVLASSNTDELLRLRRQNRRRALQPVHSSYAAPLTTQAAMVFLRTQRFLWRNVSYTFGRLTGSIALGLLMGSIYLHISFTDTFGLTGRSLYIYMQVMLIGVITSNNVVPQVGSDRLFYYRERRASMYHPIFYPIAWVLAEIPYLLLASLAFAGIGNALAQIATDTLSNFLIYWLCLFVFTLSVAYFGMLLTLAFPQPVLAAFVVSIITSIWVSGSGVVVPLSKISQAYRWVFWTNPYQYVVNTLTAVSFYCDTDSDECKNCVINQACSSCPCVQLSNLNYTFAWDRLDEVRSIREDAIHMDFVALLGMSALFATLAFFAFAFLRHNANPANR